MPREPFLIILGTFGKKNKNFRKMLISCVSLFSFWSGFTPPGNFFSDMTKYLGRSFQGLVDIRAVLAGVAETYRKNPLEVLKLSLAVGPFILGSGARKESASHHRYRNDKNTTIQKIRSKKR